MKRSICGAPGEYLERWETVFLAQNTPSESKKTSPQAQNFDLLLRVNDYVEFVNCMFGRCDMMPSSPGLENNFVGIVIEKCIMNVASSTDGDPTGLRHVQPRTRAFPAISAPLARLSRANIAEKDSSPLRLTGCRWRRTRGNLSVAWPTRCRWSRWSQPAPKGLLVGTLHDGKL